jgi:hypothetical protein
VAPVTAAAAHLKNPSGGAPSWLYKLLSGGAPRGHSKKVTVNVVPTEKRAQKKKKKKTGQK